MLAPHRASLGFSVHRDKLSDAEGHKMLDLAAVKENYHLSIHPDYLKDGKFDIGTISTSPVWGGITFTFSHFADAFYPKRLTIGEYKKRLILKRQTDRGSARNTKSQALFK